MLGLTPLITNLIVWMRSNSQIGVSPIILIKKKYERYDQGALALQS